MLNLNPVSTLKNHIFFSYKAFKGKSRKSLDQRSGGPRRLKISSRELEKRYWGFCPANTIIFCM